MVIPGRPELSMSESEPVFSGASSSNSWSTIHSRARQTDLLMSQQLLFGSSENQYRFSQNRQTVHSMFFLPFPFFFKHIPDDDVIGQRTKNPILSFCDIFCNQLIFANLFCNPFD